MIHKRQELLEEDFGIHPQRGFIRKGMEGDGGKRQQVFIDEQANLRRFGEDETHGRNAAGIGVQKTIQRIILAKGEAGNAERFADLAGDKGLVGTDEQQARGEGVFCFTVEILPGTPTEFPTVPDAVLEYLSTYVE